MSCLISPSQLSEILEENRDNVVILDCRFDLMNKDYGKDSYKKGHIKGAYLIDIENDLTDTIKEHGGRHPFKNEDELRSILQNFGINNNTTVIAYDDGDLQGAGRLAYQLRSIGHKKVYVLDGGLYGYINSSLPVETKINIPQKCEQEYIVNNNTDLFVDVNYVKSKLYNEDTIIIDSRSKPRYLGLEEPVDKIAGHIPSAKSYFFQDVLDLDSLVNSGYTTSFKEDSFLKNHYEDLIGKKEIIVYCGSGISLMVNALALEKCGINFKIYPGSYSDWISYEDNKIMTGEE